MANFASRLAKDFQSELDELVKDSLQEASEALLQKYKERLASLVSEIGVDNLCIAIDPVKFIDGSVSTNSNFSVDHLVQSRQIRSGERWVANENKAWYKPWTWFEESGHSESSYRTEEFVSEEKLASEFLANAEKSLQDNIAAACKYATKQANNLSSVFCAEKSIALRLQPSATLSLSVLTMNSRRTGINGRTRYIKISFRSNDSTE